MITGVILKSTGNILTHPAVSLPFSLLGLALVAFGVWASYDREMGAKLFLGFSFDDWDLERPAALFYVSTFSLICLYGVIEHGA